jgi:adenylate kinase family enzyme
MLIQVLGAPGAGVSTLAARLASLYECSVLEADDYHWIPTDPPYVQFRSNLEKSNLLRRDLRLSPRHVFAGSLSHWSDELAPMLTACILLTCSTPLRIERIRARELQRFGRRIEGGGEMYLRHLEFIAWAFEYDTRSPKHDRAFATDRLWVESLQCPVLVVETSEVSGKDVEVTTVKFLAAEGIIPTRRDST